MCKDSPSPRFLCLYHTKVLGEDDFTMLDFWMDENVPTEYRVVSVIKDRIITNEITEVYTIVCELK